MKTTLRIATSILALLAALVVSIAPYAFAQKPDRAKAPELGAPPSLSLPEIQKAILSNGIPVIVMEKHNVPVVQMNLVIRAGSAFESAEKVGLASLTAAMLKEGAGSLSSLELADAIDYLGVFLGTAPGSHTIEVLLHSPFSKFDKAFKLFADFALRPTFPGNELERLKKERLTALVQMYDQPTMVAAFASSKFVFGDEHPYGRGTMGTEQTIKSFTVEDVKGFYSKYFNASNATFIVVGDVKPAEIVSKLEKAFGSWTKGDAANVKIPAADQVKGRTIYLIDKPDAPQSVIRLSRVGVARTTPDYFPIIVMNTILGGSFSSRLNNNLREKHGYTYGAGSGFDMRPAPGAFTASSSVQTAVSDKAMTEFMTELKAILEQVSDQELTRAKNYLALRYPGDFETVSQVASLLSEMVLYNLPDSYFNNYIKNVLAVSKEDVQRVAKKYIDPENIAIIVVGDRKSIEKGLVDLKFGTIKNLKIEDVLGKMPVIQ